MNKTILTFSKYVLLIWIILFILLDITRIYSKIINTSSAKYDSQEYYDSDIKHLSELASKSNIDPNRILFVSEDGAAYMYFNFISYPIISRWVKNPDKVVRSDFDLIVIYNLKPTDSYNNGVYKTYDNY